MPRCCWFSDRPLFFTSRKAECDGMPGLISRIARFWGEQKLTQQFLFASTAVFLAGIYNNWTPAFAGVSG